MHFIFFSLLFAADLYITFSDPNWKVVAWQRGDGFPNEVRINLFDEDLPNQKREEEEEEEVDDDDVPSAADSGNTKDNSAFHEDFPNQKGEEGEEEEEVDDDDVPSAVDSGNTKYNSAYASKHSEIKVPKEKTTFWSTLNWIYRILHEIYSKLFSLFFAGDPNAIFVDPNWKDAAGNRKEDFPDALQIDQDQGDFSRQEEDEEEEYIKDSEIKVPKDKMTVHGFPYVYAWSGRRWIQLSAGKTIQATNECTNPIYRLFAAPVQEKGEDWLRVPFFWAGSQAPDFEPTWQEDASPFGKVVCEESKVETKEAIFARETCELEKAKKNDNDKKYHYCPSGFLARFTCKLQQEQEETFLISEDYDNLNVYDSDRMGSLQFDGVLVVRRRDNVEYWVVLKHIGWEWHSRIAHFFDPITKDLLKNQCFTLDSGGC